MGSFDSLTKELRKVFSEEYAKGFAGTFCGGNSACPTDAQLYANKPKPRSSRYCPTPSAACSREVYYEDETKCWRCGSELVSDTTTENTADNNLYGGSEE